MAKPAQVAGSAAVPMLARTGADADPRWGGCSAASGWAGAPGGVRCACSAAGLAAAGDPCLGSAPPEQRSLSKQTLITALRSGAALSWGG